MLRNFVMKISKHGNEILFIFFFFFEKTIYIFIKKDLKQSSNQFPLLFISLSRSNTCPAHRHTRRIRGVDLDVSRMHALCRVSSFPSWSTTPVIAGDYRATWEPLDETYTRTRLRIHLRIQGKPSEYTAAGGEQ